MYLKEHMQEGEGQGERSRFTAESGVGGGTIPCLRVELQMGLNMGLEHRA